MCSGDGQTPELHRRDLAGKLLRPLRGNVVREHLAQREGEESEHRFRCADRFFDEDEGLRNPFGDVLSRCLAQIAVVKPARSP
jgi:hypothetical protein